MSAKLRFFSLVLGCVTMPVVGPLALIFASKLLSIWFEPRSGLADLVAGDETGVLFLFEDGTAWVLPGNGGDV